MVPGRGIRPLRRLQRRLEMAHSLQVRGVIGWLMLVAFASIAAADTPKPKPPKPKPPKPAILKVSGYGLLGNRELKRILRTVELSGRKPEYFDPDFIEDAALILSS